ncbi:hypothetical protein KJ632_02025 [Patescibacteria group bacterium]|nr:hypothetical protein [Patescibacteria group bacterium]
MSEKTNKYDVSEKLGNEMLATDILTHLKESNPNSILRQHDLPEILKSPFLINAVQNEFNEAIRTTNIVGFPHDINENKNYPCKKSPSTVFTEKKVQAVDKSPDQEKYKMILSWKFCDINQLSEFSPLQLETISVFLNAIQKGYNSEVEGVRYLAHYDDLKGRRGKEIDSYYDSEKTKSNSNVDLSALLTLEEFESLDEEQMKKLEQICEIKELGEIIRHWKLKYYLDLDIVKLKLIAEAQNTHPRNRDLTQTKMPFPEDIMAKIKELSPSDTAVLFITGNLPQEKNDYFAEIPAKYLSQLNCFFGDNVQKLTPDQIAKIRPYIEQAYTWEQTDVSFDPHDRRKVLPQEATNLSAGMLAIAIFHGNIPIKKLAEKDDASSKRFLKIKPEILRAQIYNFGEKLLNLTEEDLSHFKTGSCIGCNETFPLSGKKGSYGLASPKAIARWLILRDQWSTVSNDFSTDVYTTLEKLPQDKFDLLCQAINEYQSDASRALSFYGEDRIIKTITKKDFLKVLKSGKKEYLFAILALQKNFTTHFPIDKILQFPTNFISDYLLMKRISYEEDAQTEGRKLQEEIRENIKTPSDVKKFIAEIIKADKKDEEMKTKDTSNQFWMSEFNKELVERLQKVAEEQMPTKETELSKTVKDFLEKAKAKWAKNYIQIKINDKTIGLIGIETLAQKDKDFINALAQVDSGVIEKAVSSGEDFSNITNPEDLKRLEEKFGIVRI